MRKPFQGVLNIIRFNWHFYLVAIILTLTTLFVAQYAQGILRVILITSCVGVLASLAISIAISHWIYDQSDLYKFNWLKNSRNPSRIVNVHAGFDETSLILKSLFKKAKIKMYDFYDPKKHTEVSIKRARKAYPLPKNTERVNTNSLISSEYYSLPWR